MSGTSLRFFARSELVVFDKLIARINQAELKATLVFQESSTRDSQGHMSYSETNKTEMGPNYFELKDREEYAQKHIGRINGYL